MLQRHQARSRSPFASPPPWSAKLDALATATERSRTYWVQEAIAEVVERELWQVRRKPGRASSIVTHHDAADCVTYRVRGQRVIILRVRDTRQQGPSGQTSSSSALPVARS